MLVVGLTGSIGLGKSTAAAYLRQHGYAVFDADAEVHRLYAAEAVPLIEAGFPGTTANGVVDRQKLGARLAADPAGFKRIEAIVHPLVRSAESAFLHQQKQAGASIAVLEIPLLFETGAEQLVDAVIVVSSSAQAQRERVLKRPGMTPDKLATLLARQLSNEEKRRRADFVVDTSGDIPGGHAQIDRILARLRERPAVAFDRHWR